MTTQAFTGTAAKISQDGSAEVAYWIRLNKVTDGDQIDFSAATPPVAGVPVMSRIKDAKFTPSGDGGGGSETATTTLANGTSPGVNTRVQINNTSMIGGAGWLTIVGN